MARPEGGRRDSKRVRIDQVVAELQRQPQPSRRSQAQSLSVAVAVTASYRGVSREIPLAPIDPQLRCLTFIEIRLQVMGYPLDVVATLDPPLLLPRAAVEAVQATELTLGQAPTSRDAPLLLPLPRRWEGSE